jgi:hypothetical protein
MSAIPTTLAARGRCAARRKTLAAKREQLAALQRRFPGYSRVALRHLLGSRFEAMGFVYALVERRRAARG